LSRQPIIGAVVRTPRLRHEIPAGLDARLAGLRVDAILRRGKYLLLDCQSTSGGGWLLIHLGMSGSLRLVPPATPAQKHDHFDLVFTHTVLRFRDRAASERCSGTKAPASKVIRRSPIWASSRSPMISTAIGCMRRRAPPGADQTAADGQSSGRRHRQYLCRRKPPSCRHFTAAQRRDRISRQRYRVLADAIRATLRRIDRCRWQQCA
jgi:hypothetical protein